MFYYVCFFALVVLSAARLLKLTVALAGFILVAALLVHVFLGDTQFFGKHSFSHWLFYVVPGFRILEFLVGMLLHALWQWGYRLPTSTLLPSYALLFAAMWFAPAIAAPFRYSLYFLPVIVRRQIIWDI
jgi:hypothetical protein